MVSRSGRSGAMAAVLLALFLPPRMFAQQAASGPATPDQVVLSVNGEQLTVADVESILQSLPPQSRDYYQNQARHLLPQFLVRMKMLAAEARKAGLDERPDLRHAIAFAAESILADAARRQIAEGLSTPPDLVAQLYQARMKEFEEVRLRRILIRTESSLLSQSSVPDRPPQIRLVT